MKRLQFLTATAGVAVALMSLSAPTASATPIDQYASSVLDFSSQWNSGSWSAAQALGAPNTFAYGDIGTAWTAASRNGTMEYLLLGFETAVYADGVSIWETFGNGFVTQIDVLDVNDVLHTVWTGVDPSLPGNPYTFTATWEETGFLVKGVKIHVDTNHDLTAWEEIDAVQLHGDGDVTSVPEPMALTLFGAGLIGLGVLRRRSRRNA